MNLEKHLSALLYRYQCVAVPGFGAFLTETISAQLNENSNSFYPPKKLISFNANLKNNDGLLANHVAKSEQISYEKAVHVIYDEVNNWKNWLGENGFLNIKNIGSFALNDSNNLVFTPVDSFNYLKTSFGLTAFITPVVKRENAIIEKEIAVIAIAKPEITKNEETESLIQFEFEPKKKDYSVLKYAAVFLLFGGIASPFGIKLYKERLAAEHLIVETKVQKVITNKIQEATFFISPMMVQVNNDSTQLNYHVVADAFKIESNADKACKGLIARGFNAVKLERNINGLYPVIYDSYPTYAEARKALVPIKKTNIDAWVLIKDLSN